MSHDDKIAIIGVGCKFPGADNVDEFWRVLLNGENHVVAIPKERWNVDAIYDSDPDAPGKTYVRKAGLIEGHDTWDNNFFGISDSEAEQIDPQQRLVLDCVHMTLENAGIRKTDLNGSSTGVYIGAMNDDMRDAVVDDLSKLNNYTITGNSISIISARVSYMYNLLGPAMTIDTACSSALVAIHTAIQGIKLGDCDMALCGGVNSILYPEMFIALSKARMLSPSGQCQSFSANADGYARGEGCGIVLLKRLRDAQKDGNYIWGTIITGCNQDGHTTSPMTAPSSVQQKSLLEKVYSESNVDPSSVQYIEAHGTGTPVGDPIEVHSLGTFFTKKKSSKECNKRINIGSVKSNIGHTESAAGVAGLIKVLLMMKNHVIVPSLHSKKLNPKLNLETYGLQVVQNVTNWERNNFGLRVACINSFGFGGTNSHAVVQQAEDSNNEILYSAMENSPFILAMSAADKWSLEQNIRDYIPFLKTYQDSAVKLSYTLLCKRDHYGYRFATTGDSLSEVSEKLEDAVSRPIFSQSESSRRIIFVFCGVGTTWNGMCRSLIASSQIFRQAIDDIDEHLLPKTNWSLKQKLENFDDRMGPFISHICIFSCQVGLSRLWRHWGINPDVVIGQSVGEVAAAFVAGYLSLKDAVNVIFERSRLLSQANGGAMAVVLNLETSIVAKIIQTLDGVSIAVYNSSKSCTLSGDADSLQKFALKISDHKNAKLIPLNVQCAYHSPYVEASSDDLENALAGINTITPKITVCSTVTGKTADNNFATAAYWKQNVRQPVLFSKAIKEVAGESDMNIFLEIGPKPVLKSHGDAILANRKFSILPSMKPPNVELRTLLSSLTEMYQLGVNPEWQSLFDSTNSNSITHTPSYKYKRKPIFLESQIRQTKSKGLAIAAENHLFLTSYPSDIYKYKVILNPAKTKFVYDHRVQDVVIVPGAIYCEIALAIGKEIFQCSFADVEVNFDILNAVFIQNLRPCDLFCSVEMVDSDKLKFNVTSDEFGKTKVASGHVKRHRILSSQKTNLKRLGTSCLKKISSNEIYEMLSKMGFSYGPSLQNFVSIKFNSEEVVTEIQVSRVIMSEISRTFLHPAILDAVLQSFAPFMSELTKHKISRIFPSGIKHVVLHNDIEENMTCYTRLVEFQSNILRTNSVLVSTKGTLIAEFRHIGYRIVDEKPTSESFEYELKWHKIKTLPQIYPSTRLKVVCFINEDQVRQKLQSLLTGFQTQFLKTFEINGEISNNMSSLIREASCILYYPGYRCTKNDCFVPNDVYDAVKQSCFDCLKIVKAVDLKTTPIIVITEDTQTLGSRNDCINLIGQELWGMARSIQSEPFLTKIHLLDINTKTVFHRAGFQSIISDVVAGDNTHHEMLIQNNELFINSLQKPETPNSSIDFRSNHVDLSCSVCVKSSTNERVTCPFFTMHKGNKHCKHSNDCVAVSVEKVFLHPPELYPLTETGCFGSQAIIFGNTSEGHQVLALEFTGQVRSEQTNCDNGCLLLGISKFEKSNLHHGKRTVAALYPSKVTSSISVPASCVIDLDKLPGYHIGTLQAVFIAWRLSEQISKKQRVCILYDQNIPALYIHVLKTVLEIRNKCQVCQQQIEDLSSNQLERDVCVIFGDVSGISPMLFKEKTNIQLILSFKVFMSTEYMHEIRQQNMCAAVKIYDFETFFDPVYIKHNFPPVKSWLIKNWKSQTMQSLDRRISDDEASVIYMPSHTSHTLLSKEVRVQKDEMFRRNACYVVIGGLTGLGWEIVKLLCVKGAGYVATLSRRKPSQDIQQQIENIQNICGNKIITLKGDVSDYTQLEAAFTILSKLIPDIPVKGIFQGAGILDDASFMNMTQEKFENVLRPKVLGTCNLHHISRLYILDYFVMHSSIASIFGNIGQTNYAAANAFLDGLAHFRRAHGLQGQSINWGALDVGMARDDRLRTFLIDRGFKPLDVENIKSCFMLSLFRNAAQITCSSFDWTRLTENLAYGNFAPLRYRVLNFLKKSTTTVETLSNDLDYESFSSLTDEEKHERIESIVQNSTGEVLKINKADILDNVSLVELGMDSQQGIEFCRIVEKTTGCKIPFVITMSNEFMIEDIVKYILKNISVVPEHDNNAQPGLRSLAGSMTYMENDVYKNVGNDSGSPMFIRLEYEICKDISKPVIWRTVFQWLLSVLPELRTIYRHIEGVRFNVFKTVLPHTDTVIDFRTTDGSVKDIDIAYEPSKDLPIRAILFQRNEQPVIQVMINSIATDLKGCLSIMRLLYTALKSLCTQNTLPPVPRQEPTEYAIVNEESLESKIPDLQNFWKNYLNCLEECALFDKMVTNKQRSHQRGTISNSVTGSMYRNLLHYLQDQDISCFQFFTSLYQFSLCCTFCRSSVAIKAKVYIQDYPIDLKDKIWESSNFIPIIMKLPTNEKIRTFIRSNSRQIQQCVAKAAYPFDLILSDNGIDYDEFCHGIAVEDISPFDTVSDDRKYRMHLHDIQIDTVTTESFLLVLQRELKQEFVLRLSFDSEKIKQKDAKRLVDNLFNLLNLCLDKPDTNIDEIYNDAFKMNGDYPNGGVGNAKENKDFGVTKL